MAIITHDYSPLTQLASNLWSVHAQTSQGIDRRMTVARGEDGRLYLHDLMRVNDDTFGAMDALGKVGAMFVPSFLHDFDGNFLADLYPQAHFMAMPSTVQKLKWPRLKTFDPSMLPTGISLLQVPGLGMDEMVAEVRHPEGGFSLVFNDAMFNQPHRGGMRGMVFRMIGSSGPLHMTLVGRLFLLKDKRQFKSWLEQQAARKDLRNVVVAHGDVVSADASAQLAAAAARL